jgi:phage terminase large subunit-like protein
MNFIQEIRQRHPDSFLLEYIDKCRAGEILVGHEVLQEFDRMEADLKNPDIRFCLHEAHKRIRFIEHHCRHFQAPYAGKPFILLLVQKAIIESIYAFTIYSDEAGRFIRLIKHVLLLMARKAGKSPFISALILAEFFCGPKGGNWLCASNDEKQAAILFNAINNMREESKTLESKTRKNLQGIFFGNPRKPVKTGKFSYQNKGTIKKLSGRTSAKEGLNISGGAVDEVHEMENEDTTMPVQQALSTQDEPLYMELSTEGFVNDGYLDKRLKLARQVLAGEIERSYWRIWLYTQDNEQEIWQDEKTWVKSNPTLGAVKKWSFLRDMVEAAKTDTATRIFVLSKDFNLKQNDASAWLTKEEIENEETFNIEDFRGSFSIGAVDLSKSGDLASARAIFVRGGKKFTTQQYFAPQSKLDMLKGEEKKRYEQWRDDGLLTISPGNENDFRKVTAWYVMLYKTYGIRTFKVGYDKWSAIYWAKEMEEDYGIDCVRVTQDFAPMSEPMRILGTDLRSKKMVYNNHPIDKWCLQNTAVAVNNKMEQMPVKLGKKDENKIDGAVTMIIAEKVYIDNRSEFLRVSGEG